MESRERLCEATVIGLQLGALRPGQQVSTKITAHFFRLPFFPFAAASPVFNIA
jgi:hypothetical protein